MNVRSSAAGVITPVTGPAALDSVSVCAFTVPRSTTSEKTTVSVAPRATPVAPEPGVVETTAGGVSSSTMSPKSTGVASVPVRRARPGPIGSCSESVKLPSGTAPKLNDPSASVSMNNRRLPEARLATMAEAGAPPAVSTRPLTLAVGCSTTRRSSRDCPPESTSLTLPFRPVSVSSAVMVKTRTGVLANVKLPSGPLPTVHGLHPSAGVPESVTWTPAFGVTPSEPNTCPLSVPMPPRAMSTCASSFSKSTSDTARPAPPEPCATASTVKRPSGTSSNAKLPSPCTDVERSAPADARSVTTAVVAGCPLASVTTPLTRPNTARLIVASRVTSTNCPALAMAPVADAWPTTSGLFAESWKVPTLAPGNE